MNNFEFLKKGKYICFLEFRNSYNDGVVSLIDKDICFVGKFSDMINHLEEYFDIDIIVDMINDAVLNLFETYNDGNDILFEDVSNADYTDFEKVYIKIVW